MRTKVIRTEVGSVRLELEGWALKQWAEVAGADVEEALVVGICAALAAAIEGGEVLRLYHCTQQEFLRRAKKLVVDRSAGELMAGLERGASSAVILPALAKHSSAPSSTCSCRTTATTVEGAGELASMGVVEFPVPSTVLTGAVSSMICGDSTWIGS